MIDITMLGSGGGTPIPERHLSSMIIVYKGRKILIDVGEGTQVSMKKLHTGFRSLDIICITHFHGDHIFGLPGLLSTLSNSGRIKPVTIIGPNGLKKIVEGLLASLNFLHFEIILIEEPSKDLHFNLSNDVLSLSENNRKTDDIVISTLKLEHSTSCIGYSFYIPRSPKFHPDKAIELGIPQNIWGKLQMGKTVIKDEIVYRPNMVLGEERKGIKISFITDTRPTEHIVPFIKNSNLFVCEGTYGDDKDLEKAIANKHMTFREAAKLASDGEVKRLLLTHFGAGMQNPKDYKINAVEEFTNTIIGYDGYKTTLSYED